MAEPNTPQDPQASAGRPRGIDDPQTGMAGGDAGSDAGAGQKSCTYNLKTYKHGESRKDGKKLYWCLDAEWVLDSKRSDDALDPSDPWGRDAGAP